MEPYEKLRAAMLILAEVRRELDLTEIECECCGLKKYRNYEHMRYNNTLKGGMQKLRRISDEMERKSGG